MSDCAGCDHPEKYGHNAYCPESRIDELKAHLAEAEALLREAGEWIDPQGYTPTPKGAGLIRDLRARIDAHIARKDA